MLKNVEAGNRYNTRKRNYVRAASGSYSLLYQACQCCQINGVSSVLQTLQTHFVQQSPLFAIIKHCVYNLFCQRNVISHARWPAECCQLLPQPPQAHPHALFSNYRHISVSNLVRIVSFSTDTDRHFYFPNSCLSKHWMHFVTSCQQRKLRLLKRAMGHAVGQSVQALR